MERPRLQLSLSTFDRILESLSLILLAILCVGVAYCIVKLPQTIPIHFNASGTPDGFGSKFTLLILPGIAMIMYLGLSRLNRYPHVFNYVTEITEQNAFQQYTIATRMMRFLKLSIMIIFNVLILYTYLTATGITSGLSPLFLPVFLVLTFVSIVIGIVQSLKHK